MIWMIGYKVHGKDLGISFRWRKGFFNYFKKGRSVVYTVSSRISLKKGISKSHSVPAQKTAIENSAVNYII